MLRVLRDVGGSKAGQRLKSSVVAQMLSSDLVFWDGFAIGMVQVAHATRDLMSEQSVRWFRASKVRLKIFPAKLRLRFRGLARRMTNSGFGTFTSLKRRLKDHRTLPHLYCGMMY